MKGIILAGGRGTRLAPATRVTNKHLLNILNEPMILFPIRTLKHLGITEILIVSGGGHVGGFAEFLGDGSDLGVDITYKVQKEAGGIAQALGICKDFADNGSVAVILGDNIFDNDTLPVIKEIDPYKAYIYTKADVPNMCRFGVLRTNHDTGEKIIIEKPEIQVWSDTAITGLYIYPNEVFSVIPTLKPSARGELEISDVNEYFLRAGILKVLDVKGFWSDAGTPESMMDVTAWAYTKYRLI